MTVIQTELTVGDDTLPVTIKVDSRLSRTSRWLLRDGGLEVRVPPHMNRSQIKSLLEDLIPRIAKQRRRAVKQSDGWLIERAQALNDAYFDGELTWHSIRWVGNMKHRLGSCTTGGATDGDIRISERIRRWPQYVIDYIIAHEICHRKHPDHSAAFWDYLARYPKTERALGFLEGIGHAENADPSAMLD